MHAFGCHVFLMLCKMYPGIHFWVFDPTFCVEYFWHDNHLKVLDDRCAVFARVHQAVNELEKHYLLVE